MKFRASWLKFRRFDYTNRLSRIWMTNDDVPEFGKIRKRSSINSIIADAQSKHVLNRSIKY